mmetsp:Transcript_12111/g.10731  ORF Transcript_12111/g.10731 Transcript_12111/m.10731 type:complete len:171 (+) Transcript_12111:137-649(+)
MNSREEREEKPKHENYIYSSNQNSKRYKIKHKIRRNLNEKFHQSKSDKSKIEKSMNKSYSTMKPPLHDYLKESRLKRENEVNVSTPSKSSSKKWKSYLSNKKLSSNEKVQLIQENVKVIEEKALRQELLIQQATRSADQFGYEYKNNEVNDMLIDAIQAKLAMLDQFNQI